MKMEKTGCSETSAYKIQTQGNYPKENIQHTKKLHNQIGHRRQYGACVFHAGYLTLQTYIQNM